MQVATDHPLLATKLYIPPSRAKRVARSRLINLMNEAIRCPLTLISAPAGYGKTTLLSEWIPQNEHCVTWLSLDDGDSDPVRFWRYFIAALQTLNPELCKNAQRILETAQVPQMEAVLSLVLNELASLDYRFSQVLDDYHLVENPVIDSNMTFLIEHLPGNVNIVITSRSDPALPLARWRARQQLAEVRSVDLRFTRKEATVFLNDAMMLGLAETEIALLGARTEGWIAGLQLAALSIKDQADRGAFITAFAGSHRFIIDYLVEEVLTQQAEHVRDFLLSTSILDQLCAPLCDALTQSSNGQTILDSLEQANLFVVPLDNHRGWYRYHHLFAEVLRARMIQDQPELHIEMHRRASEWFEREGLVDYSIRHALFAQDIERAANLVEEHSIYMLQQSKVLLIRNWLGQLPGDVVETRPRLILAHSWALLLTGHIPALNEWLVTPKVKEALKDPTLSSSVLGEFVLMRATLARFQRDVVSSLDLAEQALGLLSEDNRGLQAGAMYNIGVAHMHLGDFEAAETAFDEAARLGETRGGPYMAMVALQELSDLQIKRGNLSLATQTCQRAIEMAGRGEWEVMPAAGLAHIYLGQTLYERNDVERATMELTKGVELLLTSIEQFVLAQGFVGLARAHLASGDVNGANETLQTGKDWFIRTNVADTGAGVLLTLCEIRLWIGQGNLGAAASWADHCQWFPEDTTLGYLQAITLVMLRLAQYHRERYSPHLQEAEETASRLLVEAEAKGWWGRVIELSLLEALLRHAQNDYERMLLPLERALALAEPEGYVRMFVDQGGPMRSMLLEYQSVLRQRLGDELAIDAARYSRYVAKLLTASTFETPTETAEAALLIEPLTDREQEILHLLSEGFSNREIAAKLVVAISTVKSHINSLYSKLGTHRRTHAVAIARDLGLL